MDFLANSELEGIKYNQAVTLKNVYDYYLRWVISTHKPLLIIQDNQIEMCIN